jgi:hypothetical protein
VDVIGQVDSLGELGGVLVGGGAAASSVSIAITPTPIMTVTIAASTRVKPVRRRPAARRGCETSSIISTDI